MTRALPVALAAFLGLAAAAAGQGAVRAATFAADLTAGDGVARVRVEYALSGLAPGDSVTVSLLDFGGVASWGFAAGDAVPVTLSRARGAARSARLELASGPGGEPRLVVTYRAPVPAAGTPGAFTGHVPVLTVDLAPERASPGLFRAELRVPPAWRVAEGFPTGLAPAGEPGAYRVMLQVVPSVVSFRARGDGAWRPALPLLLDAVAVGLLVAFALVGWRHLREPPA